MTARLHDPERLRELLQPAARTPGRRLYAILDGGRDESIHPMVLANAPVRACLYKGDLDPVLASAAPWLVEVEPESVLSDWLFRTAWGRSFGIYCESLAPLDAVARHLRGSLRVKGPAGENLLFRYYDPRVARVYLPTMNEQESRAVCGSLLRFVVEGEDPRSATEWLPLADELPRRIEHDLAPAAARLAG
jgi:hypothetical protein